MRALDPTGTSAIRRSQDCWIVLLMKAQNPKIGAVNLDELNDARLIKKLDDSGFIDKAFAAQGMKP